MSTHRLQLKRQKSIGLPAFSVLGGLLIALQLWSIFPTGVQAAALRKGQVSVKALPAENVTRAGVEVVRLLTTYTTTGANSTQTSELCTGLGVLVASTLVNNVQTASSNYVNWILTDGKLVNALGNKATCADGQPDAMLSRIDIYLSNAYNPQEISFSVTSFDSSTTGNIRCLVPECADGPVLFSFNTDSSHPQPFIDRQQAGSDTTADMRLELTGTSSELPALRSTSVRAGSKSGDLMTAQVRGSLTPGTVAQPDKNLDPGTPIINNHGELAGIYLSQNNSIGTMNDMGTFLSTMMASSLSNQVHDRWRSGMDAFYRRDFSTAHTAFQAAYNANKQFVAAKNYGDLAAQSVVKVTKSTDTGTQSLVGTTKDGLIVGGMDVPYWLMSIVGLVIVVLLLLILSIIVNRARKERKQEEEIEQTATIEAQRIAQLEALQRAARSPAQAAPVQFSPVQSDRVVAAALVSPDLSCPRCGEPVPTDANFCSNCRLSLSPSESGLHLRVKPQESAVARAAAARPLAEQPTLVPAGAGTFTDQPTLVPGQEVDEQPTVELLPGAASTGNGRVEREATNPYGVQQLKGRNLGFVVGTRSDPGIKRKYKPNEDSLFAAQGLLTGVETQPLFGLFVVADGMGGHANGEDASRLAI